MCSDYSYCVLSLTIVCVHFVILQYLDLIMLLNGYKEPMLYKVSSAPQCTLSCCYTLSRSWFNVLPSLFSALYTEHLLVHGTHITSMQHTLFHLLL
jgi:hypothetical protein